MLKVLLYCVTTSLKTQFLDNDKRIANFKTFLKAFEEAGKIQE